MRIWRTCAVSARRFTRRFIRFILIIRLSRNWRRRARRGGENGLFSAARYEFSVRARGAGKRDGSAHAAADGFPSALPEFYAGGAAAGDDDGVPRFLWQCGASFRYSAEARAD